MVFVGQPPAMDTRGITDWHSELAFFDACEPALTGARVGLLDLFVAAQAGLAAQVARLGRALPELLHCSAHVEVLSAKRNDVFPQCVVD